jgi:uncharacterized repeat protein (TIGR01451 family)
VDFTDVVSALFTNTVEITTTTPESDTDNNIDQDSNQFSQTADVIISKVVTPTTPLQPGDRLTYTLFYANAGDAAAQGVYLTDTLPAGVTYGGLVSENPDWPGTPTYTVGPPQTVAWFTPTRHGGLYRRRLGPLHQHGGDNHHHA